MQHFTIAGSKVGAGVGTPSPWPFEVRVEAAADAGYRSIGLGEGDYAAMRGSGVTDEEMLEILDRRGMRVSEIEFMFDWMYGGRRAEASSAGAENLFHMAEVFRPNHVTVGDVRISEGPPPAQAADRFGAVCDRLALCGVNAVLEFLPWSSIPDLRAACEIVERAGRPNAGIDIDVWHYFRGPSHQGQLAEVDPALILVVSLNDGGPPIEDMVLDTTTRRLLPGEGCFGLEEFLAALAATGARPMMGVEVLSDRLQKMHPSESARLSYEAAAEVLRRAGWPGRAA